MFGTRIRVTGILIVVLVTTATATIDVRGQPQTAQATAQSGQESAPPMTATSSRTGADTFRVSVRNAETGQSADADPPESVGDAGDETDLRLLSLVSRSNRSQFALDFTVERNLTAFSTPATAPPAEFDTPLLYTSLESTPAASAVGVMYDFDVETDYLREYSGQGEVVVAVYRNGNWETVDIIRQFQSGNETVVSAAVAGPGLVAVGLRHPDFRVTRVEPQSSPILSNRTTTLGVTVQNRGSRDGTEPLVIRTDDRQLATPTVSVSAGSQQTVAVPVQFRRAGTRDLTIGEYETEITVTEPMPQITVTGTTLERNPIQTGETARIEATVRNTGTAGGTGVVHLRVFGDVVTTKRLDLRPGETRTVTFTQRFDAPGSYEIGVNNRTEQITVRAGPDWESTPEPNPATPPSDRSGGSSVFDWALALLGASIVLLFGLVIVGRLKRE